MPRVYTSKYAAFTVSEPVARRSKYPPYQEKEYVNVQCPHCNETFELSAGALANKASHCLEHLRQCTAYEGEVEQAPAKKRKVTNDDLLKKLNEMQEEQRATYRLVHESSGRGPPPPTTKEELANNVREDRAQHEREHAEYQQEIAKRDEDHQELVSKFNSHLCSVCMDNLSQRLLFPCHHMCMCNGCARRTEEHEGQDFRCPICRIAVEGTLAVPGL